MLSTPAKYAIDTSALLEAYVRRYPPDIWPSLWQSKLDQLAETGLLVAPLDVYEDLRKRDDEIFAWVGQHKAMLIDIDQFEPELAGIMAEFPRLVHAKSGKSGSDPMVIALARARDLTVVSEEGVSQINNPKIPFVCNQIGIRHINLLEFIREQRWTM